MEADAKLTDVDDNMKTLAEKFDTITDEVKVLLDEVILMFVLKAAGVPESQAGSVMASWHMIHGENSAPAIMKRAQERQAAQAAVDAAAPNIPHELPSEASLYVS